MTSAHPTKLRALILQLSGRWLSIRTFDYERLINSVFCPHLVETGALKRWVVVSGRRFLIRIHGGGGEPAHKASKSNSHVTVGRTFGASGFSRLNRQTCSCLSDVIDIPDFSNDDPLTALVVTIDFVEEMKRKRLCDLHNTH
ncbi:hypothetical protein CLF_102445 [Clonorchis sinensis]|uniref:Uncharacterized protein n=1 Tax=Clonorchis sinensis TaxID=79923 RepID=G7Y7Y3_CLOSI|nr:hypothetical protein CLF_102445 [Clonorchis sinensis]